jgi:hypothetical protein
MESSMQAGWLVKESEIVPIPQAYGISHESMSGNGRTEAKLPGSGRASTYRFGRRLW